MITQDNIIRLEQIVAHYAMQDFKRTNPNWRKYGSKRNPYTLSPLTNEAREMLAIARKTNINIEEENSVKAYLLKQKMIFNR